MWPLLHHLRLYIQHSVFDVVTAFVMAAVMYSFVYGRNFAFGRSKAKESFEKQLKHI